MTRHDVGQAVEKAIREIAELPENMAIVSAQSRMGDFVDDELDFVRIILVLEERLGIEFPDETLASGTGLTVGEVATICVGILAAQGRMDAGHAKREVAP